MGVGFSKVLSAAGLVEFLPHNFVSAVNQPILACLAPGASLYWLVGDIKEIFVIMPHKWNYMVLSLLNLA